MKNRSYTVRSRNEYVEKSDATRMKERVVASIFGSTTRGSIPVDISLGAARPNGNGQRIVPVVVSFPSSALITVPEKSGRAGAFSVYVGWGTTLGQIGEITRQTRSFQLPPNHRPIPFTYEFELLLDKKSTLLSIGILDEVAKEYGLARQELPRSP